MTYALAVKGGKVVDRATLYAVQVISGEAIAGPFVRLAAARHLRDLGRKDIRWKANASEKAIEYYAVVLRLNGEGFEGKPFLLSPHQAFRIGSLYGWENLDGSRRFRYAYVEEGKGNGKALALDTPIATPGGWSTMGALKIGDHVFDEAGKPCRVVRASEVMHGHECFLVRFDDGSALVADADHLWLTEARWSGNSSNGPAQRGVRVGSRGSWRTAVRTTLELASTLRYRNGVHLSANHSIPTCGALELPAAELPIPPYALGVWLGDGNSGDARVTCPDVDVAIIERIRSLGISVGAPRRQAEKAVQRYQLGKEGITHAGRSLHMTTWLRELGVLGDKHIPATYLRASIEQRLELLRGIVDTDGCISKRANQCEITTVHPKLADGLLELIASLGFKVTCNESDAQLNGRVVGRRWRVFFNAPPGVAIAHLQRKAARQQVHHVRRPLSRDRRIVAVEAVPSEPVRCIGVESPSQLFLAGRAMIPTHNSPELAGLGIKGLTADGVPRAEIYFAAPKKEQAMIPFRDAVAMVELSPALKSRVRKSGRDPVYNLAYLANQSFARPISNDERQSGPRPYMVLLEELHEHRTSDVTDNLIAGAKGRRNFMAYAITNSGIYGEPSLCWNWREKSIACLEARTPADAGWDDGWFAYIASVDEGEDPLVDESCWPKANPNLGVSIQPSYLRERVRLAKTMPSQEGIVRRLNFCQWIDAVSAWLPLERWDACDAPVNVAALAGKPAFYALDLSSTRDFTALVLVFPPEEENGTFALLPFIFCPEETLRQRVGRDRNVPYEQWVQAGHLITTNGDVVDQDVIKAKFLELAQTYRVVAAPFDRWNASKLVTELQGEGFNMVATGQGYESLSAPTKLFEQLVLQKRIAHAGHPVLRWMMRNVMIRPGPAEAVKPDKAKSKDRIDGIVASIMGVGCASITPIRPTSIYDEQEMLIV